MTPRTAADAAILVRLSDGVASQAPLTQCAGALGPRQGVGWARHCAGVQLLGKLNLFSRKALSAQDRRPGWSPMPASHKLVIFGSVALATVQCGKLFGNHKSVVIVALLRLNRAVAVVTGYAGAGMLALRELMHNCGSFSDMALIAFPCRPYILGTRLGDLYGRSRKIDNNRGKDQCGTQKNCHENGLERHGVSFTHVVLPCMRRAGPRLAHRQVDYRAVCQSCSQYQAARQLLCPWPLMGSDQAPSLAYSQS